MKTAPEQAQPMAAEQAADFAALQAAASQQAPAPGTPEAVAAEAAAAAPDMRSKIAGELSGLVLAFVAIAKPVLPSLSEIYTQETTEAAAAAVAAVCVKHGWLDGGLMGEYGEEIAAAVVVLPLGFATLKGIQADLASARARDQNKAIGAGFNPVAVSPVPTNPAADAEPKPEPIVLQRG